MSKYVNIYINTTILQNNKNICFQTMRTNFNKALQQFINANTSAEAIFQQKHSDRSLCIQLQLFNSKIQHFMKLKEKIKKKSHRKKNRKVRKVINIL